MSETTKYEHLQEMTDYDRELIHKDWRRITRTWEVLTALAFDPPFRLRAGNYQSPAIYMDDDPSEEEVEVAQAEAKEWIRRMAAHCRAHGFTLHKYSNDYNFGFKIEDTNLDFSVPTQLTCKKVPILDDKGHPIIETVSEYQSVEVEVERVRTEKQCISLVAPEDF